MVPQWPLFLREINQSLSLSLVHSLKHLQLLVSTNNKKPKPIKRAEKPKREQKNAKRKNYKHEQYPVEQTNYPKSTSKPHYKRLKKKKKLLHDFIYKIKTYLSNKHFSTTILFLPPLIILYDYHRNNIPSISLSFSKGNQTLHRQNSKHSWKGHIGS